VKDFNQEPITQPIPTVISPDESGEESVQRYVVVVKYVPDEEKEKRSPKFEYQKIIFKKKPGIVERCEKRIKHMGQMRAIYMLDLKAKIRGVEIFHGKEELEFDKVAASILNGHLEGKSQRQVVHKKKEGTGKVIEMKPRYRVPTITKPAIPKKDKWTPPYVVKSAGIDKYEQEVEVI